MSKAMQRALEAGWTHKECLAWAVEHYKDTRKWPTKRWRLEGSRAGNSALLARKKAQSMSYIYGGKVVEVIPQIGAYKLGLNADQRKELEG